MKMKNKKQILYIVLFLFMIVFFCVIAFRDNNVSSLPPSVFTQEDISKMESFVNFKFPDSTKIIKTYWDHTDYSRLYLFFEFDKSDVDIFKSGIYWDKAIDKVVGDMSWKKIQNPYEIGFFTPWVLKMYHAPWIKIGRDRSRPSEELEWWKPNKEKIEWAFEISQAKLKNVNVFFNKVVILLENGENSCRAFVFMSWYNTEGAELYMQNIESLFPIDPRWEYRIRESKMNPMLQDRLSESKNDSEKK
jgi:hypothetical protein